MHNEFHKNVSVNADQTNDLNDKPKRNFLSSIVLKAVQAVTKLNKDKQSMEPSKVKTSSVNIGPEDRTLIQRDFKPEINLNGKEHELANPLGKEIIDIGMKTASTQQFTIMKEDEYDIVVHLEKDHLDKTNSIIEKLKGYKGEGFNFISTEKANYKVNTYTDGEYYHYVLPNEIFYLAKDKYEISERLNTSEDVSNSATNSEDNIRTGTSYDRISIDLLIDKIKSKDIFLPKELSSISLEPSDLNDFSSRINSAINVQLIDMKYGYKPTEEVYKVYSIRPYEDGNHKIYMANMKDRDDVVADQLFSIQKSKDWTELYNIDNTLKKESLNEKLRSNDLKPWQDEQEVNENSVTLKPWESAASDELKPKIKR